MVGPHPLSRYEEAPGTCISTRIPGGPDAASPDTHRLREIFEAELRSTFGEGFEADIFLELGGKGSILPCTINY